MNVTITIDKGTELPNGTCPALQRALVRNLSTRWPEITVEVKRGTRTDISLGRVGKADKEPLMEAIQAVWEDADGWMPETH